VWCVGVWVWVGVWAWVCVCGCLGVCGGGEGVYECNAFNLSSLIQAKSSLKTGTEGVKYKCVD